MGAFEKFVSADKLFWESSKTEIQKISGIYINNEGGYQVALKRYYQEYSIDIFDKKNIENFFNMYPITTGRLHKNFRIINLELKEIQKTTDDYVTDFLSYQKCLNNYYERHGADTEWLVKIFAERYDLERFNISPEDVLDDLHKIMKEKPMFPSLKEMSLNSTEVSPTEEIYQDNDFENEYYSNSVLDEEMLFQEVNGMPLDFEYPFTFSKKYPVVEGICNEFFSDEEFSKLMSDTELNRLENLVATKRNTSANAVEYNKRIELNLLCEIYKYAYLMNTIIVLDKYADFTLNVDFSKYWSKVQDVCIERIHDLRHEKQKYPHLEMMLRKYNNDTRRIPMPLLSYINGRENDYMVADLMTVQLSNMVYSIVNGSTYKVDKNAPWKRIIDIIKNYPPVDVCAVINAYIVNVVVLRLSAYGNNGMYRG